MTKIAPRSKSQLDASINLDGVELNKPRDDFTSGGKKRQRTNAEIEHQNKVAELGCICCRLLGQPQWTSTHIHHVRISAKRHNNHFNVLPLCYDCHQSNVGVHGDKSLLKAIGKNEIELLEIVRGML